MEISETEKLNLAIIHGSKGYEESSHQNDLTNYLSVILYELIIRDKLTQKDLVEVTGMPKQSINKGIHYLKENGYLELMTDPEDKRTKFCKLTDRGMKYARTKMASLFRIEEKTAQKLGAKKMRLLTELNEEWSNTFWQYLKEGSD